MSYVDRLKNKAEKNGWDAKTLNAKIRRRDKVRTVARNVLSPIVRPVLETVASLVPGGTIAMRAIGRIVESTPDLVRDVPILADVEVVGEAMWEEHLELADGNPLKAALRDLAPMLDAIEERDWPRVAAYIAVLGLAVAALLLLQY